MYRTCDKKNLISVFFCQVCEFTCERNNKEIQDKLESSTANEAQST